MKKFFKWYWEHIKSAYSFGGYPHPLNCQGKEFWRAEWRHTKSLFIVAMLPQAILFGLLALAILGCLIFQ
jgi:hypothetical protein